MMTMPPTMNGSIPPPAVPPYCYYKCYGYDFMGLKTVRLFSNENDYFSRGTCATSSAWTGYKCGPTLVPTDTSTNPAFACDTAGACLVTPPPPAPPPDSPGAPPFESGYADANS